MFKIVKLTSKSPRKYHDDDKKQPSESTIHNFNNILVIVTARFIFCKYICLCCHHPPPNPLKKTV